MLKAELIEKNKNLIQQNGELMYLLEFGKLRCEDSEHQMIWERDSNAILLQQRIDKAIEFTNKNWGTWCTHHIEYMTELQNILKEGKK